MAGNPPVDYLIQLCLMNLMGEIADTHDLRIQGPGPLCLACWTCQAPACFNNSSNLPFPTHLLDLPLPSAVLLPPPFPLSVLSSLSTDSTLGRCFINSLHIPTNFSLSNASPVQSFRPGASWTVPAEVR